MRESTKKWLAERLKEILEAMPGVYAGWTPKEIRLDAIELLDPETIRLHPEYVAVRQEYIDFPEEAEAVIAAVLGKLN